MSAPHTQHGLHGNAAAGTDAAETARRAVRQDARLSDVQPLKLALLIVGTIVATVLINHLAVLLSSSSH